MMAFERFSTQVKFYNFEISQIGKLEVESEQKAHVTSIGYDNKNFMMFVANSNK